MKKSLWKKIALILAIALPYSAPKAQPLLYQSELPWAGWGAGWTYNTLPIFRVGVVF